ncbi:S41 family peptidase [Kitasatospora viridis]|uniref:Peptidase S41-like protein n=1 Tax=Kitasatospora viridis TaxID=281105 RepID=A0A561T5Z4_9ACTN|nr:S41 family peptidase [Kitasatospora viridis]TWF82530.1 peptidase S41-like protein [Kitasatospora viridis]
MRRPSAPSTRRLHAYVHGALREIRSTALFSSAVAWEDVDREAQAVLGTARCYADTHAFLTEVLQRAGGRHSHLTPPPGSARSRERNARLAEVLGPPVPTGRLVGQGSATVAHLRLPRLPEGRRAARRYLADGATVMNSLIAARPCGWIVDLRANLGGGMWPMLAVAAPLLPEGVLGHFRLPDGRVQSWSARHGRIRLDRRAMARVVRTQDRPGEHAPVAVLTSRHTASAGEAVALAFRAQPRARLIGAPTAGMTTGNRTHVLRDGTRLHISSVCYADQHQALVEGPIPVDHHLADNSREIALSTALSWIHHTAQ